MPLPKIILVPTDFGEPSEAALDYAIDYARALGGEVVLMHSYEIPIIGFPDGAIVATAELTARILEGAQAGLDRQVKNRENCGVTIRGIVKQGDAYHMVNETVDEVGADLIVMGTHGRKGIPRVLIGSVAEKVVRTAHVPVLTVHVSDAVRPQAAASVVDAPAKARPDEAKPRAVQNGREAPPPISHR
jgi:nucleotide-binding universal stress UspA family protein